MQTCPFVTIQKNVAAGIIVNISSSVWHQMSNSANVFASGNSSSSQAPTRTFLRSNRTLQHRQALLPSGSSASSDSSLLSQQSGVKFGRAARVGALGVAAGGGPAPQRGTVVKGLHKHISTFVPVGDFRLLSCAMLCCAMLCHAVLCHTMLCHAVLCHAMLCCAMPCHVHVLIDFRSKDQQVQVECLSIWLPGKASSSHRPVEMLR